MEFRWVLGGFEGSFKDVSRKFQRCFKEVSRGFQGSFKGVAGKIEKCSKRPLSKI